MTGPVLDRKVLFRRRRGLIVRLARRLGLSPSHVYRVAVGERRSPRLERELARALRLSLRQAFPEWYGGSGQAA